MSDDMREFGYVPSVQPGKRHKWALSPKAQARIWILIGLISVLYSVAMLVNFYAAFGIFGLLAIMAGTADLADIVRKEK